MVTIRLARGGSKKRPFYRIVAADSRMPRDGRFIEKIGRYDPRQPKDSENRVQIDGVKAAEWIKKGAKPTDRVHKMLAAAGLAEAPVIRDQPKKSAPGKKRAEREAEAAAAEGAPAEEATAEEAPPAE